MCPQYRRRHRQWTGVSGKGPLQEAVRSIGRVLQLHATESQRVSVAVAANIGGELSAQSCSRQTRSLLVHGNLLSGLIA